jgi:hypothetical protein
VIASSTALQYSYEGPSGVVSRGNDEPTRNTLSFTDHLVAGLATGEADINRDGLVEVSELYDYVSQKMRDDHAPQTPVFSSELEGPLYVAYARTSPAFGPDASNANSRPHGDSASPEHSVAEVSVRLDQEGRLQARVGRRSLMLLGSTLLIRPQRVLDQGAERWVVDLAFLGDHHASFAEFMRAKWPAVDLAQPLGPQEIDWFVTLPGANAFDGAVVAVQLNSASATEASTRTLTGAAAQRAARFSRVPYRGLVVCGELGSDGEMKFPPDLGQRVLTLRG